MNSFLPGIIVDYYDGKKGNVRPLIQLRFKDGSYLPFDTIEDVPIITPATANAGLKLPVKIGDKVQIHIADGDIQTLLFKMSTAGLEDPGSAYPQSARKHNLTDAVAYTGFQSLDDMIPSDEDVWIFNGNGEDYYSHIRLKADGSIETKTQNATVTLTKEGNVSIEAPSNLDITAPTSTFNGDVQVNGTLTATVDCISGNVSGKLHTHTGNLGNPTSPPIA